MMAGETVLSGAKHPGTRLQVCESGAGFYIGFVDKDGAPYSRESVYFGDRESASYFLSLIRGHSRGE